MKIEKKDGEWLKIDDTYFPIISENEIATTSANLYAYYEIYQDKLYFKFGKAKNMSLRYGSTNSNNTRMLALWKSSFGDEPIHKSLQTTANAEAFKLKYFSYNGIIGALKTDEAYEIKSLEGAQKFFDLITEYSGGKIISKKTLSTYQDSLNLIKEIQDEGAEFNTFDLCPRWGKTYITLQLLQNLKYDILYLCSYVGTVEASYKQDIDTYKEYKNILFVNPDYFENDSIITKVNDWLKIEGNKVLYYIQLTGTFNEEDEEYDESEDSLSTFVRRTQFCKQISKNKKSILTVEEADFGSACPKQIKKIEQLYKNTKCSMFIAETGTKIEKTEAFFPKKSKAYFKRDYLADVLQRPNAVGINWKILNNSNLVKYFEYSPNEMENFSDMMQVKDGHMKEEAYFKELFRFLFNSEFTKANAINRKFRKQSLLNSKYATMIFTPVGNDIHIAVKNLLKEVLGDTYYIQIIDGDITTNAQAENLAKNNIAAAKGGSHVIFIASGMANRSWSVGEVGNIILLTNGGSYSSITQKVARGWTPCEGKKSCNVIDFRMEYNTDKTNLGAYLSGLATCELDTRTGDADKILERIAATDKLTFDEYFADDKAPFRALNKEELRLMMKSQDFMQKKANIAFAKNLDSVRVPMRCEIDIKSQAGVKNENEKGDNEHNAAKGSLGKKSEDAKQEKNEIDEKKKHLDFLIQNFQVFNSGKYKSDILKNEFEDNMTKNNKSAYEDAFGIDMNTICDIAKVLIKNNVNLDKFAYIVKGN